jgi:hypothetical protein
VKVGTSRRQRHSLASLQREGEAMSTASIENGSQFITLEDALAGELSPPPLTSEFSVLLIGVLKSDAGDGDSNGSASVRLYPADGREDQYYLIKKADIDRDRIEPVSPDLVAGRGWIAEKVVRIRVRASAQLFAIQAKAVEARSLGDELTHATAGVCNGTTCAPPFRCVSHPTFGRACANALTGAVVPCPTCTLS